MLSVGFFTTPAFPPVLLANFAVLKTKTRIQGGFAPFFYKNIRGLRKKYVHKAV